MLYPWQQLDYHNLISSYQKGSYNCLLLHGALNSGSDQLATALIQTILCQAPQQLQACGSCSACLLYSVGNHPDYLLLAPDPSDERKNSSIKVEQVRELIDFASKSQHLSAVKVLHLAAANLLNQNSANALLKILEEPPRGVVFILQAGNIKQLLPTITSRCFKYLLNLPTTEQALNHLEPLGLEMGKFWLDFYAGEPLFTPPLTTLQLELLQSGLLTPSIGNIFNLTKELDPKKIGMSLWLELLLKWLSDLASLKLSSSLNYFKHLSSELSSLATRANLERLFNLYDELVFLSGWSEHPLNHKLQLENLLLKYQQIYA